MGLQHFLFFILLHTGSIQDTCTIPRSFFTNSNIDKFGHYMVEFICMFYMFFVMNHQGKFTPQYKLVKKFILVLSTEENKAKGLIIA